ncbi:MAG: D-glycero-beta-D-manno-heptose 1,7-bisphosphate 7-phosphatase [Gammaproteobacteria bacterium]|nr:D-glycero-beta-D-manno-heptose 1,7-bisphosphate 7-phosphatase [Gammaproteobacteria bacterium]
MRLAILDRDGVINEDSPDFVKTPEQWVPIPGSLEAIARLCRAEYRVVIITNQSGVGRGLFTLDMMNKINMRMFELINQKGGEIDALLFCPHTPDAGCECRKPKPGMFNELARRLKVNLTGIPAVGDSIRDLEAAVAAGAAPVLVRTGQGEKTLEAVRRDGSERLKRVPVYDNLAAFVDNHMLDDAARAIIR